MRPGDGHAAGPRGAPRTSLLELRGAFLDRTSDRYSFAVWPYLRPLCMGGAGDGLGYCRPIGSVSETWQLHFEPSLRDALAADVFEPLGKVRSFEDFATTPLIDPTRFYTERVTAFVLAGQRDRAEAYMVRGRKIRVIDLWIQALNEAADDEVIAAAVRRQVREVRDFFAAIIRDGQERGIVYPDRDPEAEAWLFVAGGLLATMDHRLGGLLGDDLQRVRHERRRWMVKDAGAQPAPRKR